MFVRQTFVSSAAGGSADSAAGRASSLGNEALFASLYPMLRRFAEVVCSYDLEPDDVVQEALALALRAGGFAHVDDPAAYLRRTIVNLDTSHRRRSARRHRVMARSAPTVMAAAAYPSDLAWLQALSPIDRAVLYLSAVDGMTSPEIGSLLGMSDVAVRLRLSRGRRRLRHLIAEDERHG